MSNEKHSLWPMDLQIWHPQISEATLSPDGSKVVYAVRMPLMTADRSEDINHLYMVNVNNKEVIQLTYGAHSNYGVRWSPDGKHIAFISNRNGKANIYVMHVQGGEAWALTEFKNSNVTGLEWAPDGCQIAFVMPDPPTEEKEKAMKAKDDPILWDVDLDFAHLYRIPFLTGPLKIPDSVRLTTGRFHVVGFDWLPNGEEIVFAHRPFPADNSWPETRLAVVSMQLKNQNESHDITDLKELALIADYKPDPRASPDGKWVACTVGDQPVRWAFSGRVICFSTDGDEAVPLAYTPDGQSWMMGWSKDSQHVFVVNVSGIDSQIWALPVSGAPGHPLTNSPTYKTPFLAQPGDFIVYTEQDFEQLNTLCLMDSRTKKSERLITPTQPECWPQDPFPRVEILHWKSFDGLDVEGYVILPTDYQVGSIYPLVVQVHGGPAGYFSRVYLASHERYLDVLSLAANGIATLRVNPRGSGGYGKEFRFANMGDWGGGDFQDIMAGVDLLIERGIADPERLGITGWSYGGFMTSWVITQTQRFKAACVGAGVTNLMSFNGTADIPGFIPDYFGGEYWEDLSPYQVHSPVFQVKGVQTPTLILHGEKDIRVPLSQGREYYNALKRQGVPVEMVIYPRQGHALTEPRMRMDARRRAADWFIKWLANDGS